MGPPPRLGPHYLNPALTPTLTLQPWLQHGSLQFWLKKKQKIDKKSLVKTKNWSNLWIFVHNFWTRNARKPIDGLKDLDYNLVSTKILSQKISSCGWGPGPDGLGQKGLNLPHLWCHTQKSETKLTLKICLNPNQETRWIFWTAL